MLQNIPSALLIITILFSIILLVVKVSFSTQKSADTLTESVVNSTEIIETDSNKTIAIPGFEKMQLIARKKEQSVYFYNPIRNNCYFELTLLLPGGEEIFHSGLLAPGKTIESITLNYTLEPGIYRDSILVYSCYSMGNMSPLNGANITFDLEVIS